MAEVRSTFFPSGECRIPSRLLTVMAGIMMLFLPVSNAISQTNWHTYEDSLSRYAANIMGGKDDFIRFHASKQFTDLMSRVLIMDGAFAYPFDSLKSISILTPSDASFRIFTWIIPRNDGEFEYGGMIQIPGSRSTAPRVMILEDHSAETEDPATTELGADNWYGCLYYRIIENTYQNKIYYTLLGWDGNNRLSKKKIIEVLRFTQLGEPVFGYPLFIRYPGKVKRVIFEYDASVTMSLNYATQHILVRVKKGKKRKMERIPVEMIVFDRLVPSNPNLVGLYHYYVPETNLQDGFVFEKGRWRFLKEVDARNPEKESVKRPRKPVEYDLFPDEPENK